MGCWYTRRRGQLDERCISPCGVHHDATCSLLAHFGICSLVFALAILSASVRGPFAVSTFIIVPAVLADIFYTYFAWLDRRIGRGSHDVQICVVEKGLLQLHLRHV